MSGIFNLMIDLIRKFFGKTKKDNWARNQVKQVFKLGGKLVL